MNPFLETDMVNFTMEGDHGQLLFCRGKEFTLQGCRFSILSKSFFDPVLTQNAYRQKKALSEKCRKCLISLVGLEGFEPSTN